MPGSYFHWQLVKGSMAITVGLDQHGDIAVSVGLHSGHAEEPEYSIALTPQEARQVGFALRQISEMPREGLV